MTAVTLDAVVFRRGRQEARFSLTADPDSPDLAKALSKALEAWLTGEKWAKALWPQFELIAYRAGTWSRVASVRAS